MFVNDAALIVVRMRVWL